MRVVCCLLLTEAAERGEETEGGRTQEETGNCRPHALMSSLLAHPVSSIMLLRYRHCRTFAECAEAMRKAFHSGATVCMC